MDYSSLKRRNIKPKKNILYYIVSFFKKEKQYNRVIINRNISNKRSFKNPNRIKISSLRKIRNFIIKIVFVLCFFFFILLIFWVLFSSKAFKIKNVSINIENKKYTDTLNCIIDKQKQENFFIWKQDNLFLFDKNKLISSINKLSNDFFYNIDIEKKFPNKLIINIKERSPKVVFFTDEYKYYFDENGKIILKTNNILIENILKKGIDNTNSITENKKDNTINIDKIEEYDIMQQLIKNQEELDSNNLNKANLNLEKETEKNNIENKKIDLEINNIFDFSSKEDIFKDYKFPEVYLGQKIDLKDYDINKDHIVFINKIEAKLLNKAINIKKIYLETISDIKLIITTDIGYEIYFNINDDIDQQIEYLGIIIRDKIKEGIKNIKYIDLRFGSKIYYK